MKLKEQLENLSKSVSKSLLRDKVVDKQGHTVPFLNHYDLMDLLNERVGLDGWEWKFISQEFLPNKILNEGEPMKDYLTQVWQLTIIGDDRSLSRQSVGDEVVGAIAYGSTATNAEASAFRRCCAKFGLGKEILHKKKKEKRRFTDGNKGYGTFGSDKDNPYVRSVKQAQKQAPKKSFGGSEISPEEWKKKFGSAMI